ncbi:MAG: hypothetical protein HZA90_04310 [Verrucomicrobia bacterium]|nr:hypothetical protein [Verrucomicrobiota bacterium]
MKLASKEPDRLVFTMSRRERSIFQEVLQHYPLVPVSHHRLSRQGRGAAQSSDQELLEHTMAAEKDQRKGQVAALLGDSPRFTATGNAWRIAFSREEAESLLQVLNDVRVGSWLRLGCPDPDEGKTPELTSENAPYVFLMELSGHFECELMEALEASP